MIGLSLTIPIDDDLQCVLSAFTECLRQIQNSHASQTGSRVVGSCAAMCPRPLAGELRSIV